MADPDREPTLSPRSAAILLPALLIPVTVLAALVMAGWAPLLDLDARINDAAHTWALQQPFWTDVMIVWSEVFDPTPLRLAALLLVIWLIRARRAHRLALWVAVTMAAGGILAALAKLVVLRDRPEFLEPVARAAGYAFPSGHAANAALAAAVFLIVLLPLTAGRPGRRAALWTAAVVVAVGTGLTRIGIGVHWTSDVLAGWCFGLAVVAATTLAFRGVPRLSATPIDTTGPDRIPADPVNR